MQALQSIDEHCPYCGANITLLIDCSEPDQEYTEDCRLCCQPIIVQVQLAHDDRPQLWLRTESE